MAAVTLSADVPTPETGPPGIVVFDMDPLGGVGLGITAVRVKVRELAVGIIPVQQEGAGGAVATEAVPGVTLLFASPVTLFVGIP